MISIDLLTICVGIAPRCFPVCYRILKFKRRKIRCIYSPVAVPIRVNTRFDLRFIITNPLLCFRYPTAVLRGHQRATNCVLKRGVCDSCGRYETIRRSYLESGGEKLSLSRMKNDYKNFSGCQFGSSFQSLFG